MDGPAPLDSPLVRATVSFREGSRADLAATFALSQRAIHDSATRQGVLPPVRDLTDAEIRADWLRRRPLIEFTAAQPGGRYLICESGDGPVGFARIVRFGGMEELTDLMVSPAHQHTGIGRALLERCWPGDPTPELGRIVVASGFQSDLSLYLDFGVMPISGHWRMRQRTEEYLALRSHETDASDPAVHVLKPDRAVAEWERLEPLAIGHDRRALHEFFARDRTCLGLADADAGEVAGLCWVSPDGEIGPAVAASPGDLVPALVAALDRVAKAQEPEYLSVFATTLGWWLLRRLRTLGFRVWWPGWVMCSVPLPGLDRYAATRPAHLL
jgi:GNAT superfamily N-acetyltransferase